jgi:protease IV
MQKSFLRETATTVMKATVVVATIIITIVSVSALYEVETGISDGACNIAVLPIEGVILPYHGIGEFEMIVTPETVESFMATAEKDESILGVLLEINSPGGTPVASQRIAERFKTSSLPVISLVGDTAASGGYMVASASDYIVASPMSSVGSIGVTMSYLEESKKNEEEGITYVQLTSGKFKDTGTPNRPLTDEERNLLESDLQVIHNEFVNMVANYRDMEVSSVAALADGSSMPGKRAVDAGLVDSLGNRSKAQEIFAEVLGLSPEEIIYCEYESSLLPF